MLKEKLNIGIIARTYGISEELIEGLVDAAENKKPINLKIISMEYNIEENKIKEMFEGISSVISKYQIQDKNEKNPESKKEIKKQVQSRAKRKRVNSRKERKSINSKKEESVSQKRPNPVDPKKEKTVSQKRPNPVDPKKVKIIDSKINEIESTIESIKGKTTEERTAIALEIIKKTQSIKKLPLSLEQSRRLSLLYQRKFFVNSPMKPKVRKKLVDTVNEIAGVLADQVDIKQTDIEDVNQLRELKQQLTGLGYCNRNFQVTNINGKIQRKIEKLTQANLQNDLKNNISENIKTLANSIAMGAISIEEANNIIEEEAKIEQAKNNKLNEEQHKKRIKIQVREAIKENSFHVKDENVVEELLQQVIEIPKESAKKIIKQISNEER